MMFYYFKNVYPQIIIQDHPHQEVLNNLEPVLEAVNPQEGRLDFRLSFKDVKENSQEELYLSKQFRGVYVLREKLIWKNPSLEDLLVGCYHYGRAFINRKHCCGQPTKRLTEQNFFREIL